MNWQKAKYSNEIQRILRANNKQQNTIRKKKPNDEINKICIPVHT